MIDPDSLGGTSATVRHAKGGPQELPVEMVREWHKVPESPEPDFMERWVPIAILVLGVGWTAFLLAVLAHRLGWA